MTRYCVIGAGAAGISTLQQLRQAGFDVDCFEKTNRVGGHWHTDYDALHLISSRDTTVFEDFPMPAGYPHFPSRDQIRTYIESYARRHGLYDIIRFNTAVTSVVPRPSDNTVGSRGWTVSIDDGVSKDYDGVFVANGHLWDPFIPVVPGTFTSQQIHSSSYTNVEAIAGRRVLVVGAGNSGCDLAVDVAQSRYDVDIVIRRGMYFQSKTYFGRPRHELGFLAEFSPGEQDLINRLLARVTFGEWKDYPGLPEPEHRTIAESPTVANNLLLYWIQHGRIRVVPGIERFDGSTVHFTDGTHNTYDTILWATGFNVALPFLAESAIRRCNGVPLRYGAGIVPAGLERLYFIGLTAPRGPMIPIYGIQAKLAIQMAALHEPAGEDGAGIEAYLSSHQRAEDRLDMPRNEWFDQVDDARRLLTAHPGASAGTPHHLVSAH